ncbi:MAG: RIP metalloprotease RseP [Alphaproteobacteria bacterium]
MDIFNSVGISVAAFIGIFSVLVFFHELGHFWVARRFGIRVDAFSIGFGPTLAQWVDKNGTEWKISALPLGGYVKFFGDASGASNQDDDLDAMPEADRADCFHYRPLYQRAAVVFAGPLANFLLAIVLFAGVFMTAGQAYTPPVIHNVIAGSVAEKTGFQPFDEVVDVDGVSVETFQEMAQLIAMNPNRELSFHVVRDNRDIELIATPEGIIQDTLSGRQLVGRLGISSPAQDRVKRGPIEAFGYAILETRDTVVMIGRTLAEIVTGNRSIKELGGPLKIGQVSGEVAQISLIAILTFTALLSVNLGLINLLPIPMLDGGHLLYYAFEAVRGKPLGMKAQEYGFRLGMAFVLLFMVVVTWNDIIHLAS